MKTIITALIMSMLGSCMGNVTGTAGLTGTYATYWENEFHKVHDTVIVTKAGEGKDIFQVERRKAIVTGIDGKVFPKKHETETWLADYDPVKDLLIGRKMEREFVWDKTREQLVWGTATYHKLR